MDDFIKYAKEEFGVNLILIENDVPDTFESIFGFTTSSSCDNCTNNPKNGGSGIFSNTGNLLERSL